MSLKKLLVVILAAIAILALAVIALAWLGARTDYARNAAARWISGMTGLPTTVASVSLGYFPGPTVEIGGLAIAQPPGFGAKALLEVGEARVSMPWSSLFGASDIESISVADAVARLQVSREGKDNWSALIDRLAQPDDATRPAWSVGKLEFERGALDYADAAGDSDWHLTAVTLGAEDVTPGAEFPALLRLAVVAGDNTIHFALEGRARMDLEAGRYQANGLDFRGWVGGEPLPLAGVEWSGKLAVASFDDATGIAAFDRGRFNVAGIPGAFAGTLDLEDEGSRTVLRLTTDEFAPRAPAIAFGHPLPETADAQAFGSMQLSLVCRTQGGVMHLDPVDGRFDDTQFHGSAIPGERRIRASFDQVDVDRYLAPGQTRRREEKETLEAAIASLGEFDIDAELRIEEGRVAGAMLRDIVIRVERDRVEVP